MFGVAALEGLGLARAIGEAADAPAPAAVVLHGTERAGITPAALDPAALTSTRGARHTGNTRHGLWLRRRIGSNGAGARGIGRRSDFSRSIASDRPEGRYRTRINESSMGSRHGRPT